MSNIIISSFNSIYNKLKFRNSDKVNINKQFNDNTNNSDSNSDSNNANLNNIITINKIRNELEIQNNILKNLNVGIQNNNYKVSNLNKKLNLC